ncbi:hypothetical protein CBB_2265 [Clostridium botulinum Bf]|nr:hypothetical protein CBB_2265 [Clostridium botulinum Bf]
MEYIEDIHKRKLNKVNLKNIYLVTKLIITYNSIGHYC